MPPQYNEYGVVVDVLKASGVLDYLSTKVLDRRAGSFEVVDLVLFLLCFFSASSRDTSIAAFAQTSKRFGNELAALGGRARWPSQASVSRALGSVSLELARDLTQCLFAMTQSVRTSKLCSATGYRDGIGAGWSVLHWDTTVDTVRKRALPEDDGLPAGVRLSAGLAAPGYPGRKRGEAVFARSIVSDATSSVWIHMDLGSGSGSATDQMARAVEDTVRYVGASPEELAKVVMVCDGVSGGVPQTRAALSAGMHVLTRICNYGLLQTVKAKRLIEKSQWQPVEDSRSGPRREAIDLGTHKIDGHLLRIIASRFLVGKTRKKTHGAGVTIDGYHYELFHSTLPIEGWAANDLVTLYYGRTAIENRFAAEDRQFDLSRIFSFSEAGQLLGSAIAMTLWNLQVAAGIASVPETTADRPARPRPEVPHTTATEDDTLDMPDATVEEAALEETSAVEDTSAVEETRDLTHTIDEESIAADHVERFLKRHPNWSGNAKALKCPAGKTLKRSRRKRDQEMAIRFRVDTKACTDCTLRSQCTTSTIAQFRKEVTFQLGRICKDEPIRTVAPVMELVNEQPAHPPFLPDAPTLLPAVLRRRSSKLFATVTLTVLAPVLEEPEPSDEHVAIDIESRQRRRQSIAQRVAANARTDEQAASATLHAPPDFVAMFTRLKSASRSA